MYFYTKWVFTVNLLFIYIILQTKVDNIIINKCNYCLFINTLWEQRFLLGIRKLISLDNYTLQNIFT